MYFKAYLWSCSVKKISEHFYPDLQSVISALLNISILPIQRVFQNRTKILKSLYLKFTEKICTFVALFKLKKSHSNEFKINTNFFSFYFHF